jgi:hypothetical protein
MSLQHSPRIITDGLVLCLDAANKQSYPGSGTVWRDLAGSNNGTLTNGPTFNSANGGGIAFDGVNDFVNVVNESNIANSNEITAEIFVKIRSSPFQYLIFRKNSRTSNFEGFIIYSSGLSFGVAATSSTGTQLFAQSSQGVSSYENIYHVVGTFKSNNKIQMFTNGVQTVNSSIAFPLDIANGPTVKIARSNEGFEAASNAIIYSAKIYNRILTPAEIQQNYNAIKGRYNL